MTTFSPTEEHQPFCPRCNIYEQDIKRLIKFIKELIPIQKEILETTRSNNERIEKLGF